MPRKTNKRKKIQATKRKAELLGKPKPRRADRIAATPGSGLGLAMLAMQAWKDRNYD